VSDSPTPYPWIGAPAERGAWLLERLDAEHVAGLGDWVPDGFEAYVRVLHPFSRHRPETGTWEQYDALVEAGRWEEAPETLDEERIFWREAAAAFGRSVEATTRSEQVLGARWGDQEATADDGWRYSAPAEGSLDLVTLSAVMAVLLEHTTTPDRGVAAVWEGFGGLTSANGVGFLAFAPPRFGWLPGPLQRMWSRLTGKWLAFVLFRDRFGTRAALRNAFLPGAPQPAGSGLLSEEAAAGPRLELPSGIRAYICFEAELRDFESGSWPHRAPWVESEDFWESPDESTADADPESDDAGRVVSSVFGAGRAQSPNLIWPGDRAWVVVTEIDFDSTIIGCSRACADGLLAAGAVTGAGSRTAAGRGTPEDPASRLETFEICRDTEELWSAAPEDLAT